MPETVVNPSAPGIVAAIAPAGGGGGGAVFRLVNVEMNSFASVRPDRSASVVATRTVYAVADDSGSAARNVASRLLSESAIAPGTGAPSDSIRNAPTLAGSIGSENDTMIGAPSDTLVAAAAGVTLVTRGGSRTNQQIDAQDAGRV